MVNSNVDDTHPMPRVFMLSFKGIVFDTNDEQGDDPTLAAFLNSKYGHIHIKVTAYDEESALREALKELTEMSGYPILDASYDLRIS